MPVRISIQGLTEVRGSLPTIPPSVERISLLRLSQIAYDRAQAGAGRHSKSGALFASLYNRLIPGGREVGHDPQRAPHAIFVNLGTRPHEIRPKDKRALRWAGGGAFFFARRVWHPGYRGDAYMIAAATVAVREFASIVNAAMQEVTK